MCVSIEDCREEIAFSLQYELKIKHWIGLSNFIYLNFELSFLVHYCIFVVELIFITYTVYVIFLKQIWKLMLVDIIKFCQLDLTDIRKT